MAVSKLRISSPLEAGESLLEAHNLPPHLTAALDYVSKRLAKKALHVTLIVVRRDYQLPGSVVSPTSTPTSPPPTPDLPGLSSSSPSSSSSSLSFAAARFASMSPVAGLRQLVRRGTNSSLASAYASSASASSSDTIARSTAATPTFFPPQLTDTPPAVASSSPRRWPPTPLSSSSGPRTPMTPHTPCSINTSTTTITTTTTASSAASGGVGNPNSNFGIRLVHATALPERAEKALRAAVARAERKFRISTGWCLPQATPAAACGLGPDLVRRTILQNEVLFSSEGLTLLGLDRLYTFKAALAAYARAIAAGPGPGKTATATGADAAVAVVAADPLTRIEDAVDELRRLVLANGGHPVSRADLHRSYDWIGVGVGTAAALADVERMYRRAYGGRDQTGAFAASREERERRREARVVPASSPPPLPRENRPDTPPLLPLTPPPPPKNNNNNTTMTTTTTTTTATTTPVLRLNTNVAAAKPKVVRPKPKPAPRRARIEDARDDDDDDDDGGGGDGMEGVITERRRRRRRQQQQQGPKKSRDAAAVVSREVVAQADIEAEIKLGSFLSLEDDSDSEIEGEGEGEGEVEVIQEEEDEEEEEEEEEEDGDRTALPTQGTTPAFCWGGASIDSMLLQNDTTTNNDGYARDSLLAVRESQHSHIGPLTPNGYDDISPTTRGEWGFLFAGDAWKRGKIAAVETC